MSVIYLTISEFKHSDPDNESIAVTQFLDERAAVNHAKALTCPLPEGMESLFSEVNVKLYSAEKIKEFDYFSPTPPSITQDAEPETKSRVNPVWIGQHFTEREQQEIAFARLYLRDFDHGTDGHNAKIIIAKMADLLDKHYLMNTELVE